MTHLEGHAGTLAVAVARAHGVETMFTLSGAHVFPMYDGAVKTQAEGRGPRVIVLENVIGLLTSGQGRDFAAVCAAMVQAGQHVHLHAQLGPGEGGELLGQRFGAL